MNREELVSVVAEKTGISKKDVAASVTALVESIQSAVSNGDRVALTGFGTFEAKKRAARTGRNPLTGETIAIAAKTVPSFKAGKTFKDIVNS